MYHCICANKLYFIPPYWFKDVALVRLSEPMVFTTSLLPICLPSPTSGGEIHFCWDPFCIEPFLPRASLPSANFSDRHLCRAQFLPRPFFDRVIYFEPHFCWKTFWMRAIFAESHFAEHHFRRKPFWQSAILAQSHVCCEPFIFAESHFLLCVVGAERHFMLLALSSQNHHCQNFFLVMLRNADASTQLY